METKQQDAEWTWFIEETERGSHIFVHLFQGTLQSFNQLLFKMTTDEKLLPEDSSIWFISVVFAYFPQFELWLSWFLLWWLVFGKILKKCI